MKNFGFLLILGLLFNAMPLDLNSQIHLNNPSFEDEPADATIPMGWFGCQRGTTPEIMPGFWGVYDDASEGDTYVGIITRENGTFESIGQRLSEKLKKDNCYQFSLELSHSKFYSGYNGVIRLRIWIGSEKCEKTQLIYQSEPIESSEWETYVVKFTAKNDSNYITMEAFYKENPFSFKGNILIDNISPIFACDRT
jgi:hypothetical protein